MTTEDVENVVEWAEWILLAAIPAMVLLTARAWQLARIYWPYKLPVVAALVNTLVGAACSWLGMTVVYRWQVGPVPYAFVPVTSASILALCLVPFLVTGYPTWLHSQRQRRRRREDGGEERRWSE